MNFWIYYGILIILLLATIILSIEIIYAWDYQEHGLFINAQYPTVVMKQRDFSPLIKIFDIDSMGYGDWRHIVSGVNVTLSIDGESVSGKTNRFGYYSGVINVWSVGFLNGTINATHPDYNSSSIDIRIYVIERGGSDAGNPPHPKLIACAKSGGKPPFC